MNLEIEYDLRKYTEFSSLKSLMTTVALRPAHVRFSVAVIQETKAHHEY